MTRGADLAPRPDHARAAPWPPGRPAGRGRRRQRRGDPPGPRGRAGPAPRHRAVSTRRPPSSSPVGRRTWPRAWPWPPPRSTRAAPRACSSSSSGSPRRRPPTDPDGPARSLRRPGVRPRGWLRARRPPARPGRATATGRGRRGAERATTQPPNPPPVMRAPNTPGVDERRSTRSSAAAVEDSKSRARLRWLSSMTRPASARSLPLKASTNRRTRRHSVTTWRVRRRRTGSTIPGRSASSARPSGTPSSTAAASHSARRAA